MAPLFLFRKILPHGERALKQGETIPKVLLRNLRWPVQVSRPPLEFPPKNGKQLYDFRLESGRNLLKNPQNLLSIWRNERLSRILPLGKGDFSPEYCMYFKENGQRITGKDG